MTTQQEVEVWNGCKVKISCWAFGQCVIQPLIAGSAPGWPAFSSKLWCAVYCCVQHTVVCSILSFGFGVAWLGMVYGLVWCGMVWCGMVVKCDLIWYTWNGVVLFGMEWCGLLVECGLIWYAWCGLVLFTGRVWLAFLGSPQLPVQQPLTAHLHLTAFPTSNHSCPHSTYRFSSLSRV